MPWGSKAIEETEAANFEPDCQPKGDQWLFLGRNRKSFIPNKFRKIIFPANHKWPSYGRPFQKGA
jgi:hypothetical protein